MSATTNLAESELALIPYEAQSIARVSIVPGCDPTRGHASAGVNGIHLSGGGDDVGE